MEMLKNNKGVISYLSFDNEPRWLTIELAEGQLVRFSERGRQRRDRDRRRHGSGERERWRFRGDVHRGESRR